jgi:Cu(I)/Ag(I) efflux system membrane protein CusA/SilA
MRYAGVDANVVALSGIAIAIGVMVDIGIVFVENIIRHLEMPENHGVKGKELMNVIYVATKEVASAITTALATTVVSFVPVFAMVGAEGKLFRPLAFTKTFALLGAFLLGIIVLPALAHFVFGINYDKKKVKRTWGIILIVGGLLFAIYMHIWLPLVVCVLGLNSFFEHKLPLQFNKYSNYINIGLTLFIATFFLAEEWMPLGPQNYLIVNYLFVLVLIGSILGTLLTIVHFYEPVLKWCLNNKGKFMLIPLFTLLFGVFIWVGFDSTFGFVSKGFDKMGWKIKETKVWTSISKTFPGIGSEFMPTLNEGSFLLMPSAMPHAGLEETKSIVQNLDMLLANIPEVDVAVGKLGRVESAIDPAPISMFENIINYKPEFIVTYDGKPKRFKVDKNEKFVLKNGTSLSNEEALNQNVKESDLTPDDNGEFFRNWRSHIRSSDDIWKEIVKVSNLPGVTSAPKLQPIETRLVMLQTGMRAPMGIKVYGPDLKTIQDFGIALEGILKQEPSVKAEAVFADRIVGKPYLQININRSAIARYGLSVEKVQQVIETAVGGMNISTTVEGRERYPVRVRYPRELRDDPEKIKKILVPIPTGVQVPLGELVSLEFVRGPQMIKSEETFLVGYVLFDKKENFAEVDVVNNAQDLIKEKINTGELIVPKGVSYKFSGSYENQIRAIKKLSIVIPISLIVIFLLLYFQFKTIIASSIHFSGVFVAFAGGFIMLWLYGQDWFLNFSVSGVNMRHLFQIHPINLSVAVWVGFIALFGIATDDGVIMGTYIHQVFEERQPDTIKGVREAVLVAGKKRVRPAMMTAAVAIIALLPVLTSTGKGADIMIPMAIPVFGGMIIQLMTMFVVPVLQAFWRETVIKRNQ